jgi:hypothetical protein
MRRGSALGRVSWLPAFAQRDRSELTEVPALPVARNDQQPLGRWPMLRGPIWYLRLMLTSGLGRTQYPVKELDASRERDVRSE